MIKTAKTIALLMTLCLALTAIASAESTAPAATEAKAMHKVARYSFDQLDVDLVKSLSKALSDVDGVMQAKVEKEDNQLAVFFDPQKTDADAIAATMKPLAADVKLVDVKDAPAVAHDHTDCGKCPHKKSCDHASEK